MIPRLDIQFPFRRQWQYWFGKEYVPQKGEYLLNHARTGIVLALRTSLPDGGRVGVVAYNCHTVANAVVKGGCTPVFVDVTEGLKIDINSVPTDLDAIVVTNLFGIRNDISAIKTRCPKAIIIVDNAHGYGLPAEGDFTVYSINQGKFPALGEGGIMITNKEIADPVSERVQTTYDALSSYSLVAQVMLFCSMLMKATVYSRGCYWLTMKLKKSNHPNPMQEISIKQMAAGIRRLYNAWISNSEKEIAMRRANAARMSDKMCELGYECIEGENGFMLIVKTKNPTALQRKFAERGVETDTHFKHAIDWASEFGYKPGSCPIAEKMTKELLMIPTYRR